jgi:hypothetical protein
MPFLVRAFNASGAESEYGEGSACIFRHLVKKSPLHVIMRCPKIIMPLFQFLRLSDAEEQKLAIDPLHAASYGIDQVMATTQQSLAFLLVSDGMAMDFSFTLPQKSARFRQWKRSHLAIW